MCSDLFYKQAMDSASIGFVKHEIIFDSSGNIDDCRFVDLNQMFEKISGLSGTDLNGKTVKEAQPLLQKLSFDWIDFYRIANQHDSKDTLEYHSAQLNKSYKVKAIRVQEGLYATLFIDAAAKTEDESEMKISHSEKKFRLLIQNSTDWISVLDNEGIVVFSSPALKTILGFETDELIGSNSLEQIHPDDLPKAVQLLSEIKQEEEKVLKTELRLRHANNSYRWIEATLRNLFNTPAIRGIVVNARDITYRKSVEEKLRKNQERKTSLINSMGDLIFILNQDLVFIEYHQPGGSDLYVEPQNFVGKSINEINFPEPALSIVRKTIDDCLKNNQPERAEYYLDFQDGRKWFDLRVTPLRNQQAEIDGFSCVVRDFTERKNAEQALIDKELKYREITENINDVIFTLDMDLNTTYITPSVKKLLGESPEQNMKRSLNEKFTTESLSKIQIILEEELAKEKDPNIDKNRSRIIEAEHYKADGSIINVSMNMTFIRGEDGNPVGLQGVIRDITEMRATESALRIYSDLQDILISLSSKFINVELEKIEEVINNALKEMATFVSADRSYIFDYDWQKDVCNNTWEWCAEGITPQIEELQDVPIDMIPWWVNAHKKGETLNIPDVLSLPPGDGVREILEPQEIKSLITLPMMDNDQCIGFVGFDSVANHHNYTDKEKSLLQVFAQMIVNIRNRKRSQEMIDFQIRSQQLVTGISTDFVSADSKNIDQKIESMLKEAGEFFQVDRSYVFLLEDDNKIMVNTHEWCAEGVEPQKNRLSNLQLDKLPWWKDNLLKKNTIYFPDIDKMPDAAKVEKNELKQQDIQSLLCVPLSKSDCVIGFLGFDAVKEKKNWTEHQIGFLQVVANILSDAYTKVNVEKELIKSKELAVAANRAKSEFLASISHEIRTPMTAILGFSEVMLNTTDDEKQKNYLKIILESGRTLLSLINDILDLSKIEAGRMEISPEPADLRIILRELKHLFQHRAKEKNIDIFIEVDEKLPQTIVIDEVRLRQVMLNLVGNAIKFTNEGYVKIRIDLLGDKNGIIDFEISVIDTGIGIPESDYELIFEAFSQQSGQDSKIYGGTGLGLAISKRLLELMHGKIRLESTPGKGSSFIITFNNVKYSDEIIELEGSYLWDENNLMFKGSKVLIVDDVPHNRNLVMAFLDKHNLQLYEAESGEMGIQLAKAHLPDLIFMDIRMPGTSGYEATRQLRQISSTKNIPVIALTASTMQSEQEKLSKLFDGYLRKPVQKKSLINELMRFLPHEVQDVLSSPEKTYKPTPENMTPNLSDEIIKSFQKSFSDEIINQTEMIVVDDLEKLTGSIEKFAIDYEIPLLKDQAFELKKAVDGFDFEAIQKHLIKFKKMFQI
jgi:PAS domain S-box-containing protein